MSALGSAGHGALIRHVVAHYRDDERVRSVVVFGSVSTGTWHELSDVDLDVVTADGVVLSPAAEAAALFGARAAIVVARPDAVDVVLDSLEEISIRWHPLALTSPNITASLHVVAGVLSGAQIAVAGNANREAPDRQRLLDVLVRDAVGAWKAVRRGRPWDAIVAVERVRQGVVALRGRRDGLQLDPADPTGALAAVIAEAATDVEFGRHRSRLLARIGVTVPPAGRPGE
jgi:predicted nucleotidyltransferase